MPQAYLDITPEFIAQICMGLGLGEGPRWFRVTENALPHDAKVVRCELVRPHFGTIRLFIESDHVTDGEQLPAVHMEFVFAEDEKPS